MRDGKPSDATVTIGDRDKVFADWGKRRKKRRTSNGEPAESKLGIVVHEVTPARRPPS